MIWRHNISITYIFLHFFIHPEQQFLTKWRTKWHRMFSVHITHKLILNHSYWDSYCCFAYCHFFIWQPKTKKVSAPEQIVRLHVIKLLAAHWLKIIDLEGVKCCRLVNVEVRTHSPGSCSIKMAQAHNRIMQKIQNWHCFCQENKFLRQHHFLREHSSHQIMNKISRNVLVHLVSTVHTSCPLKPLPTLGWSGERWERN